MSTKDQISGAYRTTSTADRATVIKALYAQDLQFGGYSSLDQALTSLGEHTGDQLMWIFIDQGMINAFYKVATEIHGKIHLCNSPAHFAAYVRASRVRHQGQTQTPA